MQYWLMKSEPQVFSIDDLERQGRSPWEGVRNYQARNFMRDGMKVGDQAFLYHSSCDVPGVAGVMEVARAAYPDPTQFDRRSPYYDEASTRESPRWLLVDVAFSRRFRDVVPLERLRAERALAGMQLLRRGNRLSVMPVTAAEWRAVLKLA
ncbi:MAG: EVE domain-containing protein [Gammaproteobacteria bacterium]|nr:EVE domain-containing protein [Gammaproteobacteria bacterium]